MFASPLAEAERLTEIKPTEGAARNLKGLQSAFSALDDVSRAFQRPADTKAS
ncbi:MAG: hypothetical protein IT320_21595 [Anaerolineae bacterium]|nr:hypothetical protein [Anaerolineae bacterium]